MVSQDQCNACSKDEHVLMQYLGRRKCIIYNVSRMMLIQCVHSENEHLRRYGVGTASYRQDIENKFEASIFLFLQLLLICCKNSH